MTIDKLRADHLKRIATKPARVYWQVASLLPDGYGGFVENPHVGHASETFYVDNVMIANMSATISDEQGATMSFGYAQPLLLTAPWDALWLTNGMILSYNERNYRVDDVQAVQYMGAVISKIAKLTDVTTNGSKVIAIGGVEWTPDENVIVIGG